MRGLLAAALFSGSVASIASSVALALRGRRELANAATPLNGPSQWVHGKRAPYHDGFDLKHTVTGYAIHHVASIFWAVIYEAIRWKARSRRPMVDVGLAAGAAVTASAVDFLLTPERLRPGFEKRLSNRSLVIVYTAFAAGLAAAALLSRRR